MKNYFEFYQIPKEKRTKFLREGLILLQGKFSLANMSKTDKKFLKNVFEFYDELKKLAQYYQKS